MKDLAIFLTYSGISTILFLILLLSRTWKKIEANKILASNLLAFLLLFITYASSYLKWDFLVNIISPLGVITPFALGTCIFQYIKTIYTSEIDYKRFIKSLFPFGIAFFIYSIPQYAFGLSLDNKTSVFQIISFLIPFLSILHLGYYLFLSHKLLKRYRRLVKNNYANINTLDLKWLSTWIRGFILFLVIDVISGLLLIAYPIYLLVYTNLFYLVLLIWYIGYYGINQMHVFLISEVSLTSIKEQNSQQQKIKTTSFFNCESKEFIKLKTQLEIVFKEQELFKKQHLSLKETAVILDISDKKLSHLLNICLDSNFYEYVNTHRVNYFRRKLEEGATEKLTLLAIAFDSGFNSKATFNRVFKQQVGITPIEFKKQLNKRSQSFQ
ncbi:helix-turn-helix domain-containing protein [Aquimarina sp. 2201CG14-23]|uniref:helix-turn-helix domain-containing protein n=1 Tax=Aquimarina mycalae TaxID=3040073 RepID=UPI00247808D5|nr:helix-turn-helix domain-containing protein [Aquimarina sp. 2201CG14-23]MDH7447812.1 helix-turn-helix domain-containing protein [Aquimarina sp. 2201CG14-23]